MSYDILPEHNMHQSHLLLGEQVSLDSRLLEVVVTLLLLSLKREEGGFKGFEAKTC